jgi:MoxR-like ATPase
MILGAKAMALLDGQPTVTAEHIRQIAPLVLRHRILPSYNATGEGLNSADLVRHIIDSVSEPIYVA